MEVINHAVKQENKQLLVITHLSQLLNYAIGFGGLIAPLIIWLTQKDKIDDMDEHGKLILNFQLSLLLYMVISIPGIFLFGLGILLIIFTAIIGFVMPIVNAIKANKGEAPSYFATIRFIK